MVCVMYGMIENSQVWMHIVIYVVGSCIFREYGGQNNKVGFACEERECLVIHEFIHTYAHWGYV